MDTFQVNITQMVNAEGGFQNAGAGTLVIDDLRDEVRVTGFAVKGSAKAVLVILYLLVFPSSIAILKVFAFGDSPDANTGATSVAIFLATALPLGVVLLTIYRRAVFPHREIAVRFSPGEIGKVARGAKTWQGPVAQVVQISEASSLRKWVEVLPQSEAEAQAIMMGVCKLRDG